MKKIISIFIIWSITNVLLILCISYNKSTIQFIPYPKSKPFIVEYKDDCYAGNDFTHKVLNAKDTELLLIKLNERKLK